MNLSTIKWKNLLAPMRNFNLIGGDQIESGSSCIDPELGFKVTLKEDCKQLSVRVIGARHLPTVYGPNRPLGYLVKVRVFPAKDKHETAIAKESWPTFNEEFVFKLQEFRKNDLLFGKFVVLTVYAVLDNPNVKSPSPFTSKSKKTNLFKYLPSSLGGVNKELLKEEEERQKKRNRTSLNNRRTIGAVTYNLEKNAFTQRLKDYTFGTPDIWRDVQKVSSGLNLEDKRESKKGSLEVTFMYSNSEDGNNDMIEACLSKFRCRMQTMQEHEKLAGSLYIKMVVHERDVVVSKWKSDKFDPTISMKIESKTATIQATVHNYNLSYVKLEIRLMSKTKLGKKTRLGRIFIQEGVESWDRAVQTPSVPVLEMLHLE